MLRLIPFSVRILRVILMSFYPEYHSLRCYSTVATLLSVILLGVTLLSVILQRVFLLTVIC